MRPRSTLALALLALVAAGCGGGGSSQTTASRSTSTRTAPSTATHRAAAFDGCLHTGPTVHVVRVPAPGERMPAVVIGGGAPVGVVFANQSASSACGWLPYARDVARDGVRSLVFDYDA